MRRGPIVSICLLLAPTTLVGRELPRTIPLERIDAYELAIDASGDLADVYHPRVEPERRWRLADRFPVVVLLQGALVDRAFYGEYARRVAQLGFVVVVPNHFRALIPMLPPQLFTEQSVLVDALAAMRSEDADPASPVHQVVDTERLGLTGHSFGGAAALFAIEGSCEPPFCEGSFVRPPELGAAALYGTNSASGPVVLDVDTSAVPTALLQGTRDGVAVPAEAVATFELLEAPTALIAFEGLNHFGLCDVNDPPGASPDPVDPTVDQELGYARVAAWTGLFLRAYLLDDAGALAALEAGGSAGVRVSLRP